MKNKLYMMIGLPASGKTTIAEEISKSEGAIIVSSDEIRKELLGDVNDQSKNELIFKEVEKRIKEGLLTGNVIYDATNINYKKRKAFLQRMRSSKSFKAIAILVATPYEECLIRNAKRERKVPEEAIKRMYYSFYIPQYYEGFDEIEIISNPLEWDEKVQKQYTMMNLLESMNISQDNPWHTLTVRQHCEKVQELLDKDILNYKYYMRDIGIFHDIGKVQTKSFENKHNDMEEWKDIKEFQNRYQVSSFGNIRNSQTKRILKPRIHTGGYLNVNIRNDGKLKNYYIHRIVARYFCDNNVDRDIVDLDVNHKDGNKQNNFYKNLEWCTRSENVKHCFYTNKGRNRFGTDVPNHKLSYEDIAEIKRIKEQEKLSNKKISEMYNISESQITRVLNGTTYSNKIADKVVEIEPITPQKYASYYNHEKVSAYISVLPILWTKYIPKEDLIKRANLIQWHMILHFNWEEKTINKYRKMLGEETWKELEILHKADCEAR